MKNKLRLGWIGLGNMGTPMAKNLLKAGFEVTVFNRTREKEQELLQSGATSAHSPQSMVENCDVILTMLSNDSVVKEGYEGTSGLLSRAYPGRLFIDMSTVSPDTSRHLSANCRELGMDFSEAPVSGSVKPAQEGTLIILVGGTAENYEKAKPIFDVLGKLALHVGGAGVGSSAKLAINYLLGLNLQGLAETVLFAEKNGVRKEDMLNIINEGALGNGLTRLKSPSILANSYPPVFALKHLVKDLTLASQAGLSTPLFEQLFNSFTNAKLDGLGEEDCMAVIKFLAK